MRCVPPDPGSPTVRATRRETLCCLHMCKREHVRSMCVCLIIQSFNNSKPRNNKKRRHEK